MYVDTMGIKDEVYAVDLFYPNNCKCKYIQVGLSDIRAADDIRISYDYHRDGYVIEQLPYEKTHQGTEVTGEWQEVAFIKSWQLESEVTNG